MEPDLEQPRRWWAIKFIERHRIGLLILVIAFVLAFAASIAWHRGFWFEAGQRTSAAFDEMIGNTKFAAIFTVLALALGALLEMLFSGKFSWKKVALALVKWGKRTVWLIVAWVFILVFHLFFIAPVELNARKVSTLNGASNHIAQLVTTSNELSTSTNVLTLALTATNALANSLLNSNSALRAEIAASHGKGAVARQDDIVAAQQKTSEDLEALKRLVIGSITNAEPQIAALEQIASAPTKPYKQLTNDSSFDVGEFRLAMEEKRNKADAQRKLDEIKAAKLKTVTLTNCIPIVNNGVEMFRTMLADLAAKHGDNIVSGYTGVTQLLKSERTFIRMEKNSNWQFDVYFKDAGGGQYNWHIHSGPINFTCHFNGASFSGFLINGNLHLETLSPTNSFQTAFRLMIAANYEQHGLTNVPPVK